MANLLAGLDEDDSEGYQKPLFSDWKETVKFGTRTRVIRLAVSRDRKTLVIECEACTAFIALIAKKTGKPTKYAAILLPIVDGLRGEKKEMLLFTDDSNLEFGLEPGTEVVYWSEGKFGAVLASTTPPGVSALDSLTLDAFTVSAPSPEPSEVKGKTSKRSLDSF